MECSHSSKYYSNYLCAIKSALNAKYPTMKQHLSGYNKLIPNPKFNFRRISASSIEWVIRRKN